MSTQVQLRRGTTAEHAAFAGAQGEVTVDTTKKTAVVHDGATAGGTPLAKEVHTHTPADVTLAAADKIVGTTGAAGAASEITCTAAGRALLDDADAVTQRDTLGLRELATPRRRVVAKPRIFTLLGGQKDEDAGNLAALVATPEATATLTEDTANALFNGRSWKYARSTSTSGAIRRRLTNFDTIQFPPASTVSVWIHLSAAQVSKLLTVTPIFHYAHTGGGDTDEGTDPNIRWNYSIGPSGTLVKTFVEGWNLIRVNAVRGRLFNNNDPLDTPKWGTISGWSLQFTWTAAPFEVTVGHFWLECPHQAKFILGADKTFQGFIDDIYDPHLAPRHVPVTWIARPGKIDDGNAPATEDCTWAELERVAAEGRNAVSFHSWGGAAMPSSTTLTADEVKEETMACIKRLKEHGFFNCDLWRGAFFQNTASNPNAVQGLVRARAAVAGDPHSDSGIGEWPPVSRWNLPRTALHGRTVQWFKEQFNILAVTHGTMFGYTHKLGSPPNDIQTAELNALLAEIDAGLAAGWLACTTVDELLEDSAFDYGKGAGSETFPGRWDAWGPLPPETPELDRVPAGGTTGQVLKKASDDDYDTAWANETGGGGGGAPTDAQYLVAAADGTLTAERVTTNTATVEWDHTTAGQAKANVPDGAVSNAKLTDMAQATIKGRASAAGTGDPTDLTADQVSTILDGATDPFLRTSAGGGGGAPTDAKYITQEAHAGLSAEQSLGALTTGIVKNTTTAGVGVLSIATGGDLPSHNHAATDLTSGIIPDARMPNLTGDVTTSEGAVATTIADEAVTNAKLAHMVEATLKGRAAAAGTGDATDLTPTQARTLLNVADGANNYVHPNHSGDVTSTGDGATAIANDVVSNAKLANMAQATIKGRQAAAGTGDPEDLTAAQARTAMGLGSAAVEDTSAFAAASHTHARSAVTGGGPIAPLSAMPDTSGAVYPNTHTASSRYVHGMGVEASVSADRVWHLAFPLPPVLPAGTCKLRLRGLANAATGAAKVNPKWASVAAEESPFAATLQAEGTQTVTWGTGDENQLKELVVTLDADTPVAGELVYMALTFETASWTLAQVSTWLAEVIWE